MLLKFANSTTNPQLAAVLIDSHLSNTKYRYVTRSIWCLAISVVFGFFYLMAFSFRAVVWQDTAGPGWSCRMLQRSEHERKIVKNR